MEKKTNQDNSFKPLQISSFNTSKKEDWIQQVKKELSGTDFEKLYWETEGLRIEPFYTAEDLNPDFKRNQVLGGRLQPGWLNIVPIDCKNPALANQDALSALQNGAEGVIFNLKQIEVSEAFFEVLLKDIWLENCVLSYTLDNISAVNFDSCFSFLDKKGIEKKNLQGWIDYDPVNEATLSGEFQVSNLKLLINIIRRMEAYPLKTFVINSHSFYNSGADITQDLAFSLSAAVEYMDYFTENGIDKTTAFHKALFSISSGTNFFFEIARIRALRVLWARIAEGYQINGYTQHWLSIHSKTSTWDKTALDPFNNVLRNTSEAMAAVMGGCDYLSVSPHDYPMKPGDVFSKRIAKNTSILLKEEAQLDKVADPAAGSYYIESLTDSLVNKSWELFLEVEKKGGFIKAFESGDIQEQIRKSRALKVGKIEKVEKIIVGVNKYRDKNSERTDVEINQENDSVLTPQRASQKMESDLVNRRKQ